MANLINWFEIPVTDISRAVNFYSKVLNTKIEVQDMMGYKMGFIGMEGDGVGGSLVQGENYKPSMEGTLVYLNAEDNMQSYISRVEEAGGTILMPRTLITEDIGYMSMFLDSEGNKIAFHSKG